MICSRQITKTEEGDLCVPPGIDRAAVISDTPLIPPAESSADSGEQMLLTVPPGSLGAGLPRQPVRIIQLSSQSGVTHKGR